MEGHSKPLQSHATTYKPLTKPQSGHTSQTHTPSHLGKEPAFAVKSFLLKMFFGAFIVLAVMFMFSYSRNAGLEDKIQTLESQNKNLTESLEQARLDAEKAITALEKEKLGLTEELDNTQKERGIAERAADLNKLTADDTSLRMQTATFEIQKLRQELDLEKQKSTNLDTIITQMTNTSNQLQSRINELNTQLNECIRNS